MVLKKKKDNESQLKIKNKLIWVWTRRLQQFPEQKPTRKKFYKEKAVNESVALIYKHMMSVASVLESKCFIHTHILLH